MPKKRPGYTPLTIEVEDEAVPDYRRCAGSVNLTLAAWARRVLDKAAKRQGKVRGKPGARRPSDHPLFAKEFP